jgi:lysophospholipid acyltransferase (LPLAT)-like uncharacterized protein
MKWLNRGIGWLMGLVLVVWRRTCRYLVVGDRRPELRASSTPYIYALLHAHQISAVFVNDEAPDRLAAMVSRSADGELLLPSLTLRGVRAARGSSRRGTRDKGGRTALAELHEWLGDRVAVLLAVDGPRGPRNTVHRGVASLAQEVEGAVILPTMVVPNRRWIFGRTWDRIQLPRPFSTVTLAMDAPIRPATGESVDDLRLRVAKALDAMETRYDPSEAEHSRQARDNRTLERSDVDLL